MVRWRAFRLTRVTVLSCFALYTVVAIAVLPSVPLRQDPFPFFHWNLFSSLRSIRAVYRAELRFSKYSYTCFLDDCALLVGGTRDQRTFHLVQTLGARAESIANPQVLKEEDLWKLLKARLALFKIQPDEIRIVKQQIDFQRGFEVLSEKSIFSEKLR